MARPKPGSCCRQGRPAVSTRALSRAPRKTICSAHLRIGAVANLLASFTPKVGDAIFIRAGTVHSLSDVVVFEVQENSDVTFRLYDWDRVDPKTGKPRPLQVEQAVACIDTKQVAIGPVVPVIENVAPALRERLFHCEHFSVWRHSGLSPFTVGAEGTARVLVCIAGQGQLEHSGTNYAIRHGDVMLLPAEVGACCCRPRSEVTLLEIALPE